MKTTTFMKLVLKKDITIQYWCYLETENESIGPEHPQVQGDITLEELLEEYYEDWQEQEDERTIEEGGDLLDFLDYAVEWLTYDDDWCSIDLGYHLQNEEGEDIEKDEVADWTIAWIREQRLNELGL
jgi:hypothetical protein